MIAALQSKRDALAGQLRDAEAARAAQAALLHAREVEGAALRAECAALSERAASADASRAAALEAVAAEAARFADADIGAMAKQITEIRSMLGTGGVKKAAPDVKLDFTPREASVLQLVAEGMMNKEIARRLETSIRNVEKYVSRLFIKTGTASRTELVRFALEHGLVD